MNYPWKAGLMYLITGYTIESSPFSISLPTFTIICYLDDSISNCDERESQSCFNLHFLGDWRCWKLLKCVINFCISITSLENSVHFYNPFLTGLFVLLIFRSSWCIPDVNLLLDVLQVSIFLLSVDVSPLNWQLPLLCRSLLISSIRSHFLIMGFISPVIRVLLCPCLCLYLQVYPQLSPPAVSVLTLSWCSWSTWSWLSCGVRNKHLVSFFSL